MITNSIPWNKTYINDKKIWGDKPSELALYAYNYLTQSARFKEMTDIFMLDMGCGYGRDAIFLAQNLPCHILGLDNSETAIEMARESLPREVEKRIELLCYDFSHVSDKYDVILASGLYQFLQPDERAKLRETVKRCLKNEGIFFLSTLSIRDPHHADKVTPIEDDENSFDDGKYHHLCTRQELEKDFDFLKIYALFEREFREPHASTSHQHVYWMLMGSLK
jgi:cyclopropane fatty-acyl-phospholipid synthase-like methyltransferase